MNQVLRDKLRTLFFKYVEVASPEISLKSFKNVDIKGKTLLVGVGKASIPYCEKIQDKIKSQYEGIIISTKIKNVSENLNNFKNGNLNVLVSCTALDEGFDMPEADGAMILSASSSKRQRIQRMGRVLRITANKQNALIVTVYSSKTEFDKLREESNRYKLEGVPIKWQQMKQV